MFGCFSKSSLLVKVSLPQQRAQPTEKWGNPAEIVILYFKLLLGKLLINWFAANESCFWKFVFLEQD